MEEDKKNRENNGSKKNRFIHILLTPIIFIQIHCLSIYWLTNPKTEKNSSLDNLSLLMVLGLNRETTKGNTAGTSTSTSNAITVGSPTLGFTLKNGGQDSIQVTLSAKPNADVIIPVSVSNTSQATVTPSSLTFTVANWNIPQTVTITGLEDLSYGVTNTFTVKLGPSTSTDPSANNLTGSSSAISNKDFRKLIFQTSATSMGNFGGKVQADSFCNSDALKPANTGTYKALLADTTRTASIAANVGDGQVDWVLLPNQLYTRPDGTVIMTTNSASIFIFGSLVNSIVPPVAGFSWSGFASNWTGGGGCTNWSSTGAFGGYATVDVTSLAAIQGGNIACTNFGKFTCVQQ